MSITSDLLSSIGVGDLKNAAAATALSTAIDAFGIQNAGELGATISEAVRSSLPSILQNNDAGALNAKSQGGEWESVHYANDLIAHAPKYKFMFKVKFEGFGAENFYYYVTRCDKPKIDFVHQDVNYYNFRTKVKTHTQFHPLSVTFYDEIQNSTNQFFVSYLKSLSGQGSGQWGIDKGFGSASSSKPYKNGYSSGKKIIIEQIFGHGTSSNRFIFHNPRIEQFDFDDLDMSDNGISLMTVNFSYDAISCETVSHSTIHSWGQSDLLKGGGSSGKVNGGSIDPINNASPLSANGGGLNGGNPLAIQPNLGKDLLKVGLTGLTSPEKIPEAIKDLALNSGKELLASSKGYISSSIDTLSQNVADTYKNIFSGSNISSTATNAANDNVKNLYSELL